MKDEKAKYLLVDSKDITKQLYDAERCRCTFVDDFYTIHHRTEMVSSSEIFDKNSVPLEFQKVIIRLCNPLFASGSAEEYITRYPFDYKYKRFFVADGKKCINMHNKGFYLFGEYFDDKYVFNTEVRYCSFKNIMYLLEQMYKNNCLDNYLKSVKEFFNMYLDYGVFFDKWDQTYDMKKTIELHNREIASRGVYY